MDVVNAAPTLAAGHSEAPARGRRFGGVGQRRAETRDRAPLTSTSPHEVREILEPFCEFFQRPEYAFERFNKCAATSSRLVRWSSQDFTYRRIGLFGDGRYARRDNQNCCKYRRLHPMRHSKTPPVISPLQHRATGRRAQAGSRGAWRASNRGAISAAWAKAGRSNL